MLETDPTPNFAFLVLPSSEKKRAAVNNMFRAPAPPINHSHKILAWANDVHPGSPVPMTPKFLPRRASFVPSPLLQAFRRSSLNRTNSRRQSAGSIRSLIPSASFLQFADPPRTPANPTKIDLTLFGYASSFVDIPVSTPATPDFYRTKPATHIPTRGDTSPPTTTPPKSNTQRMFERFLGVKSKDTPQVRTKRYADHLDPTIIDSVYPLPEKHRTPAGGSSGSVVTQKQELYASALPPTVKQEGYLRQPMQGRNFGSNIQQVTGGKAERECTVVKVNAIDRTEIGGGVGTTHRNELGGIWWDQQEEEWESSHLLPLTGVPLSAQYPNAEGWVTYNHLKEFEREDPSEFFSQPSNKHTDSYHSCPVLVTDEDPEQFARGRAMRCASIAGSIVFPSPSLEAPNILLAVPSRPKRGKHLNPGFLKDVIAVPPTPTPPSPCSQTSCPPRSPARAARFIINTSVEPRSIRRQRSRSLSLSRKKRKPAPPPLKIIPVCPMTKLVVNVDPEEGDRRILLEDSFKPGSQTIASRLSGGTTTPGLSPACSGDSDNNADGAAPLDAPKKSRRLGRFFMKGERDFWTQ